jgi:hypothetical protein
MADPAFAEMEAEAEPLIPRQPFSSRNRDDKSVQPPLQDEDIQAETAPLLGPPVLVNGRPKTWYNTASVCLSETR